MKQKNGTCAVATTECCRPLGGGKKKDFILLTEHMLLFNTLGSLEQKYWVHELVSSAVNSLSIWLFTRHQLSCC